VDESSTAESLQGTVKQLVHQNAEKLLEVGLDERQVISIDRHEGHAPTWLAQSLLHASSLLMSSFCQMMCSTIACGRSRPSRLRTQSSLLCFTG
jgi:hypothetical protein